MKSEDKKKICNQIFSRIFFILFIVFLAIYIFSESGYYEFEQHNRMILTEAKIKEFENDIKDGKEIDIKNYIVNDKPNYDNNISKFGYMLSTNLEKFIQTSIETTFEFVSKILE